MQFHALPLLLAQLSPRLRYQGGARGSKWVVELGEVVGEGGAGGARRSGQGAWRGLSHLLECLVLCLPAVGGVQASMLRRGKSLPILVPLSPFSPDYCRLD